MSKTQDNEAELRESLTDLFFKACGGITDMAKEEVEAVMQLIYAHDQTMMDKLLEGRKCVHEKTSDTTINIFGAVPIDHIRKTYKRG